MSNCISRQKRAVVYSKTDGACAYCGIALDIENFAIDHVHPRFHGGRNNIENLLPACFTCNSSKGTKDIDDFRLYVAAKAVTGAALFSHAQLRYIMAAGAFKALGFNDNHQFYFESHALAVSA